MNTKHTPGPWSVGSHRSIQSASGTICETYSHMGIAAADSNERLIAAAPELLEACRQMMRWFEVEDDHSQMPGFMDRINLCKQVEILASAAIAKATGEAQ